MELTEIAQGKTSKEEFLKDIEKEIREVVITYSK
jgi:DNA topoisomerase